MYFADNDTTPWSLRLAGGSNNREGIIEILYYGIWGTVCDYDLDFNTANVACRHLGFPGALTVKSNFDSIIAQVWLEDIQCIGNETTLEQCSHQGFGSQESRCYSYDHGIVCIGMHVSTISIFANL